MVNNINFYVQYYNAEQEATGYFVRQDNDAMTIRLIYFDFPGYRIPALQKGLKIHGKPFVEKYIRFMVNLKLKYTGIHCIMLEALKKR